MDPVAHGTYPLAGDALGTAKQTPGQHQGRSLVEAESVAFHELHPADDGTEGRVDLMDFYSTTEPRDRKQALTLA